MRIGMKKTKVQQQLSLRFIRRAVSLLLTAAVAFTSSPAAGVQAGSSTGTAGQDAPTAPENITLGRAYIRPGATTNIQWSGITASSLSRYEYSLVFSGGGNFEVGTVRSYTPLTKNSAGKYFIKMESNNGKELAEGYYAVYLRGVNGQGKAGKAGKAMIYLDKTPPAKPSISLKGTDQVNYHCTLPVIQWSGATDNAALDAIAFAHNSRYVEIGSDSASGTYTFLPKDGIKDGKNDIYMVARDRAGNIAHSNTLTYYYDGEPPSLTLGAVTPGTTKNQPGTRSPRVAYEAKDNHGLGQLQYSLDGVNYTSTSVNSSGTLAFPPEWFMGSGAYTLYLRLTDKAGNISDVHTFTYYFSDLSQDYLPAYVTARENMNGSTVITWEKKYTGSLPDGASYSLYGSRDKGFTPGEDNLIQSGIRTNSYTVSEGEHQDIRYYKLCVVRTQDGREVNRKYTDEIYSTSVEKTERNKKAGECSYSGTEAVSLPGGSTAVRKDSGNLTYTAEGFTLPALHFSIPVTPVYNSSRNFEGILGKAWMLPQERQLWQEGNGYCYMDETGAVHRFAERKNGSASPSLIGKTITEQAGRFKTKKGETSIDYRYVMESSQGKEYYSKEGRLVAEVENDGAYLLYQYNENDGALSEIITATGRKARFHYDEKERLSGKNRLVSVTYTNSRGNICAETLSFQYSGGRLASIVHTGTDGVTQSVHAYDYENGLLSGVTSPGGKRAEILYTDGKVSRVTDIRRDRVDFSYQTDSNTLMTGSTTTTYSDSTGKLTTTAKTTFDAEGRVVEETDRQGLTTNYTYGQGLNCYQIAGVTAEREYQVLTSAGGVETEKVLKTTETSYDADGNAVKETDENGGTTIYEYGDSDNPSQPTEIQETTGAGDTSTETMTYDERGNLITDKTVNEGETTVTRNEYDGEDSNRADNGEYIGDDIIEETGSSTTIQGQESSSSQNVYDAEGNITKETILSGTTEETTTTKYDDMGRVVSEENQTEGTKTSYVYDALGRTIKTTVTYTKGEQKGTTETEEKTYDAEGNIITETARDGVVTTYRYNRKNRVISETVSKGESRTNRYSYSTGDITLYGGKGIQKTISTEVKTVKNDEGVITDITYTDAEGRTVRTYSGGIYTDTWYDRSGHTIATCVLGTALPGDDSANQILENSRVSLELYDEDGNATHSIEHPAINDGTYYVDGDSLKTVTGYDRDGNVISQTDAMGRTTKYTYKNSQLVGVVKADGTQGNTYQYSQIYDGDTVVLSDITGEDGTEQKPLADITINSRGKVSRTITNAAGQTLAMEDEADGKKIVTRYEYDDKGNKIKEIYGTGAALTFQYDTKGQVTVEKAYDKRGNQTGETAYTYDGNGNVTRMADFTVEGGEKTALRTTLWEYDSFQRLITYTEVTGTDSSGRKQKNQISYAYDTSDRLVEVSYQEADGITGMKYGYNAHGWLTRVTVKRADGEEVVLRKYAYDSHGKVSSIVDTLDYLGAAEHTVQKAYDYDQYDRATAITVTDGKTRQVVQDYRYTYDRNGNIIKKTEKSGYAEPVVDRVTKYRYNKLGELIVSSRTDYETEEGKENRTAVSTETTRYTYDTAGNRTGVTRNGSTTAYTYNGLDQLTSAVSSGDSNESKTYAYDEAGNQTMVTATDSSQGRNQVVEKYTYDTRNQLTKVARDDGNGEQIIQENWYDGNGQRISRREGNRSTDYYYQNGSVLKTTDGTGALQALYLYGAEGNPIALIDGSGGAASGSDGEKELVSYLYTKDMQGSIVNLVDETGAGVTTYTYDDYGTTAITGKQDTANELAYTGGVYDQATETYYLNARFYRPEEGRFLSMDTYRGDSKECATWNLYGYCGGDPVNYVDPSGHKKVQTTPVFTGPLYCMQAGKKQAKMFWNMVIKLYLLEYKGWKLSATLLQHSLQDKPKDLRFGDNSTMVKTIKKSSQFQKKIKAMVTKKQFGTNAGSGIKFDTGDLFGALNKANIWIDGSRIGGNWNLRVRITDYYDFKIEQIKKKNFFTLVGNNVACIHQYMGFIHGYNITITFKVTVSNIGKVLR